MILLCFVVAIILAALAEDRSGRGGGHVRWAVLGNRFKDLRDRWRSWRLVQAMGTASA